MKRGPLPESRAGHLSALRRIAANFSMLGRGTLVTATLAVTAACDTGMTIRQASSPGAAKGASVAVNVTTSRQLVGETWYWPDAKVTNSSESPITIIRVELSTRGITYANKPRSDSYPLIVPPRETAPLDIFFDLHDNVKKTFEHSAKLRVHYRSGNRDEIADVDVIGGPLDTSAR